MRESIRGIETLRNLRDGDLVWVRICPDADSEEIDAVQTVIASSVPADVTVMVTPDGFLESIQALPLSELMDFRAILDEAIAAYTESNAADRDV